MCKGVVASTAVSNDILEARYEERCLVLQVRRTDTKGKAYGRKTTWLEMVGKRKMKYISYPNIGAPEDEEGTEVSHGSAGPEQLKEQKTTREAKLTRQVNESKLNYGAEVATPNSTQQLHC